MSFIAMGRERERERVWGGGGKLIASSINNLYDSDGLTSLCVTVESKSSDLKLFEVQG
jgi:hypothetical protein